MLNKYRVQEYTEYNIPIETKSQHNTAQWKQLKEYTEYIP